MSNGCYDIKVETRGKRGKIMAEQIKSVKVNPSYETMEIAYRQKCGWEFVSTQEIYNKDTHLEGSVFGNTITSVTETTHYVKLTFKRDPNNVKSEILELERQIDNLYVPEYPNLMGTTAYLLCFCFLAGIGVIIPWSINKNRKRKYEEENNIYQNQLNELMTKLDQAQ